MKAWWYRLRWATCGICDVDFRKGHGGGVSRRTVCSDACWTEAWRRWLARPTDPSEAP